MLIENALKGIAVFKSMISGETVKCLSATNKISGQFFSLIINFSLSSGDYYNGNRQ